MKPGRGYNPAHFDTMVRALSVSEIPNQKTDVNINPRPLGFPFAEENASYVNGDDATRQRICERHRELTLGLLWFLQNDREIEQPGRVALIFRLIAGQAPPPPGAGCGGTLDWWFSDEARNPKPDPTKPKKPRRALTLADLPPACETVLEAK